MQLPHRTFRLLLVLALAIAQTQKTTAKPQFSQVLAPTFGIQPPPSAMSPPDSVAKMAYAYSDGEGLLYIQGGQNLNETSSFGFFSLDLEKTWSVDAPAWTTLQQSLNFSGTAGAMLNPGQFLVLDQDQAFVYNKNAGTFGSKSLPQQLQPTATSPLIVTDTAGHVFFLNEGIVLDSTLTTVMGTPKTPQAVEQGQAASWSTALNAILSTVRTGSALDVQMFSPDTASTGSWERLHTAPQILSRAGHCFVPNFNGSKFYLFGGVTNNSAITSGDLYILDVGSRTWSLDTASPSPRSNMACAFREDTLVIWGGYIDYRSQTVANNTPLLYNVSSKLWVHQFTKPVVQPAAPTPTLENNLPSPNSPSSSSGSNMGAIIGGAVGGVVLVALLAVLFVLRRRSARYARNGSGSRDGLQKGNGKTSDGSHGSVEMGGYTTIPSPFTPSDTFQQPLYTDLPPMSQQRQYAPPIPPKSFMMPTDLRTSGISQVPIIQSPFESETDASSQYPLLRQSASGHADMLPRSILPPPALSPYHDQRMRQDDEDDQANGLSRSMEPATVDLIPITASEAGEGSQASRSNSIASTRSVTQPVPSRTRSRRSDQQQREAEESRRDSTESLEYLDI
ncbi:hypothetical protein BC939DRAFT_504568 [Gamsiella multidivaricata]|uniref:uncharacterized protein n=1 Tax=Gamsiella multidivaricata TaxID=101098 RepID=UPI00221FC413|nr:uncharacterized protein BC939DRAFT_504568 [Gamsiella multidivaricata]KAG0368063.1 hypothetical protein BGZ54_002738 [Gamsiella multidivaricata]KAI7821023.1 hypothetical protein BC939DRAFT_504568 [Gamsiella multidivaricata]